MGSSRYFDGESSTNHISFGSSIWLKEWMRAEIDFLNVFGRQDGSVRWGSIDKMNSINRREWIREVMKVYLVCERYNLRAWLLCRYRIWLMMVIIHLSILNNFDYRRNLNIRRYFLLEESDRWRNWDSSKYVAKSAIKNLDLSQSAVCENFDWFLNIFRLNTSRLI